MSFRLGAAALLLSTSFVATNAYAADLGGDCCADLEERVAELEATTARKGNRKVSLTVYGQVNTGVMFWDNGVEDNVYVVDNDVSSTRFGFKGKAKITPDWSAGFKIEIEAEMASSNDVDEGVNTGDEGPNALGIRKAEWYLKSKTYGKVTVGQGDSATSGITEIDLSGTNVVALFDDIKAGQDIGVYDETNTRRGSFDGWTNGGNFEFNRVNRVRYDTPTFAGFVASAAWGEDDIWDVAIRYAGEFGGFKLAAGIGYGESTDEINGGSNGNTVRTQGGKISNTNGSASVLHTPTGLFVTAGVAYRERDEVGVAGDEDVTNWFVRGGISQKFVSLGKTAFYGEYQNYDNDQFGNQFEEAEVYGVGIVQKIDAAAMELYLSYRHISVDDETARNFKDLDVVLTGARIKF